MAKVKLGDIAETALGKMLDAKKNKGELHPYLANIHVRWGGFDLEDLPLMRFEDSEAERFSLRDGDLVMCEGGEPGRCAIWREQLPDMRYQKALHRIRPHENVDVRWLYYWFLLQGRVGGLNKYFVETTIKHLVGADLRTVEIDLPELDKQIAVADVLTTIDDIIANNKKLMVELEATARLIYDYWFTQFDFPDENGKPYRTSGGKMTWSSELKREIPDKWQIIPVRDACSIIDCLHSKKPEECYEAEGAFLLQLDNLVDMGMLDLSWKYYVSIADYNEWTSRIELQDGDMVITNAGRVGGMARIGRDVVTGMGRNMTGIRPVSVPAMFMWYFFQSPEMQRQIANNTDSGSFFGSLNVIGIKSLMFVLPPSENTDLLNQFSNHVEPLRRQAEALQQENLELIELRNWLLPMLMNGQLIVG